MSERASECAPRSRPPAGARRPGRLARLRPARAEAFSVVKAAANMAPLEPRALRAEPAGGAGEEGGDGGEEEAAACVPPAPRARRRLRPERRRAAGRRRLRREGRARRRQRRRRRSGA